MTTPRAPGRPAREDDETTRVHVRASQPPPPPAPHAAMRPAAGAPAKPRPPHWVADDDETLVALEAFVPPAPLRTPMPMPSPFAALPTPAAPTAPLRTPMPMPSPFAAPPAPAPFAAPPAPSAPRPPSIPPAALQTPPRAAVPVAAAPTPPVAPSPAVATGTPRIVYTWVAVCGAITAVGLGVLLYIQR